MYISTRLARWTAAAVVALGVGLLPGLSAAQATEYHADLSGSTVATGAFAATVDVATGTVTYTLTVPSIQATTAAHIHAGAEGVSGPVVVPLFAADGSASSINVSGTFGLADLVGPYAGDLIGFVTAVNNGTLYVNVHTEANPAGEIRGQIVAGAAPVPTLLPTAPSTGNAGLSAAQGSASTAAVALLFAAAVALVLGGRMLTAKPRTR
jgi:hypothetical protein